MTQTPSPTGALTYRYVAMTDVGRRRSSNEDSAFASSRVLALADGMGGAVAGELASSEAVNVVRRLDVDLQGDATEAVAGAVHRANDRLAEVIESQPATEGMGTTLVVMLWDGSRFALAHIGDSRAYRFRDGELTQITKDHTFVQSLVDEGRLTPAEARTHPHRSLIIRVLLGSDDSDPDLSMVEPQEGDRYLLCSDGVSDYIDDAQIAEALASATIDDAAVDIVQRSLAGGGGDNITCVIAEMVLADAPADDSLAGADGRPMLVGAAAEQPRPPSDRSTTASQPAVTGDRDDEDGDGPAGEDVDPEAVRYAPQAPSRWRWLRRGVILAVVVLVLVVAARWAYGWSQDQYFVAESDGRVAIFQGVQADVPLLDLERVHEVTDVTVDSLPTFGQQQVRSGIEASSLADARRSVQNLQEIAARCADPSTAGSPGSECDGVSP
ncbi:PP2C family protein-serine/threonine phosphatase [Solicola sp. PLA-1-18]|uniref:PP2C family protein-serine/threonine phosphatase n=1 Tax=Solicola sp. PLA-1-18 TaxID=3380532 RepID=UPI003B7F5F2A